MEIGASTTAVMRTPFLIRTVRSHPYVYSAICKARIAYSRRIAGSAATALYRDHRKLFSMSDFEARHCEQLQKQGFALIESFFPTDLIDRIYTTADRLFRNLHLDFHHAYSVQDGRRRSLEGVSYEELSHSEKVIALRDPLQNVPDCIAIAFHESILRIAGNFLGYIPPLYRPTIVRDFPHARALESSNFHKDNDETDSVQVFVYLVDIDDSVGALTYVAGSHRYDAQSCRPRLSRDLGLNEADGRLSDCEVEKYYPRRSWAVLTTKRGSIAIVHGNGIHKGPVWARPGDPGNRARTAIKIDIHGFKRGASYDGRKNRIEKVDWDRLSKLQKLFANEICI